MSTLMVSVSGIRGIVGDGLDPHSLVKYTQAYADFCGEGKIIIGSDGRISGTMVKNIVIGTLLAKGNDVVDLGITPTPTVLYNIKKFNAVGGIVISASHNPNEWNALKLLNSDGEFMTPEENKAMLELLDKPSQFKSWDNLGKLEVSEAGLMNHLQDVLSLKYIDVAAIRNRRFKVLLDCVNGAGSYIMPNLLEELGCEVIKINCEKNGIFPRLPEPIPENLSETMKAVIESKAEIGIVVDPDVDRLVLITEKGKPFVEENTITQAVKFILGKEKGDVVVNLSTTRAVEDVANEYGVNVYRSPVGEANVVKKMKEVNAVIGGEGSGGVILPALHYGRDALVGTVITLQHLLEFGGTMSELKKSLPQYHIAKGKVETGNNNPDEVVNKLTEIYKNEKINTDDGLRIDFDDHWAHFR
ncbi:MAG TPA: phosphoglucosamine mutase, partial [Ignavibacteria bacterium]|nr:phosphoglucosamine mutase [Ignavibacteria bacterium]